MFRLSGLLCALLALFCVLPACAKSQNAAVYGTVYDARSNPLPNVTVKLENPGMKFSRTTTTGPDGSYSFAEVPPAQGYRITAMLNGKKIDERDDLSLGAGDEKVISPPLSVPVRQGLLTATVHGFVYDGAKRGVPGATVTLQNPALSYQESVGTDGDGSYSFEDVPAGKGYDLSAAYNNRVIDTRTNVTVAAGAMQAPELSTSTKLVAPPDTLKVDTRVNPIDELTYVHIPAGSFVMGCSQGDPDCDDVENPAHMVTILKDFWIGQTVVTARAFKRYSSASAAEMPDGISGDRGWTHDAWPIVNVTWREASSFCKWGGGRLPTEAEWEYAARGGKNSASYGAIEEIGYPNEPRLVVSTTGLPTVRDILHPVGQKKANPFGLYDLLGNVRQWTADWYDEEYYSKAPARDPQGPVDGNERVVRGSGATDNPRRMRVSLRDSQGPKEVRGDLGFRCVWGPSAGKGSLDFTTVPGGVQIYINDEPRGLTSEEGRLLLRDLAPGPYRVRASLIGYKDWAQEVTLPEGKDLQVNPKLEVAGPKPLHEDEIERALANNVPNPRLTTLVKEYGVDFALTPELQKTLRARGADDTLLLAIATNQK